MLNLPFVKFPKINIYFAEIILILITGLIPLLWYKEGTVALGHDMTFPLAPIDFYLDRLYTWTDRVGSFGSNQTEAINGIFIHGLETLFSFLGFSLQISQKLTFVFWFVLPGITMYILLRSLHPQKEDYIIRISGPLFYMLNHYLLQAWLIAERTKFSIVAALPLVTLVIINVVIRKKSILKQSIILSLILFILNGGAGIPLLGGLFIVGVCVLVVSFIYSSDKWVIKLLRTASFILLSLIFFILVNLYWIYPYISSYAYNFTQRVASAGGIEGITGWSQIISRNASIINLLRMQGIPDWYDNLAHPYARVFLDNPIFILLSLIFPIVALVSLTNRATEHKNILSFKIIFLTLLIVGIPFVAGSHNPFGVIYDFLLTELPGFSMFRTPYYKFGMVVWFAYAYLVAVGLGALVYVISKKAHLSAQKLRPIVLIIFIFSLALYNYPFFTGSFFNFSKDFSTMLKVPDYIFDAKKEIDKNKFSTRTLLLPEINLSNFQEKYNWKYFSLTTIPVILTRRPFVTNDVALINSPEMGLVTSLYDQIRKNGRSKLISLLGIDKVLVRSDFSYQKDTSYSPEKTFISLNVGGLFSKISSFDKWEYYAYLDEDVKPLISAPQNITYLSVNANDIDRTFEIPYLERENSFIWQDPKSNFNPEYLDNTSNLVLQALCINCPNLQASYDTKFIVPRILPGTRFYSIAQLLEERRRAKLKDPAEIIEHDLTQISKGSGALWVLIKDYRNTKPIGLIADEWKSFLDDIKIAYGQLPTQSKDHYSHKIYYFLRKVIFGIEDIINEDRKFSLLDEVGKRTLNQFRPYAEEYTKDLGLEPAELPPPGTPSNYKVDIPKSNGYQISLFSGQDYITNEQNIELDVNGKIVNLKKDNSEGWYVSDPIQVSEGQTIIDFPLEDSNYKDLSPIKDFRIEAPNGKSNCVEIPIGNIDPKSNYLIKFNFEAPSGAIPFFFYLYEVNNEFPSGKVNEGLGDGRVGQDRKGSIDKSYVPNILTESVFIRFCADALERESALVEIKNFRFLAISPHSTIFLNTVNKVSTPSAKLEFVALNQTKYLVRVRDFPQKWFIDFNSRFDNSWQIRQVNTESAKKYFQGERKEYFTGQVIEYAKLDKHILTDLIFPYEKNNEDKLHIFLNSFSNGWYINSELQKEPLTFLIEYKLQNDLYKTAAISLISILILGFIYVGRRIYEEFNN